MAKKRIQSKRLSRAVLLEAARAFGRQGGKARLDRMTADERREVARKAAQARWAKKRATKQQEGQSSATS